MPERLQMNPEDVKLWWKRIELARTRREREKRKWKKFLSGYLPPNPNDSDTSINSNVHFRDAHLKIAEVYAQFPEIQLIPLEPLEHLIDPATGQPFMGPPGQDGSQKPLDPDVLAAHIVAIKRAVLNKLLGSDCANVDLTIIECLFDIFAVAGVAFTKICYEADVQETPQETPGAPTTMPGAILGLQDVPGQPVTQMQPVVVNERFRWYRFSPAAAIVPHDYHSTDYDRAPYLGMEFEDENNARSRKAHNLPDNFSAFTARGELIVSDGHKDPAEATGDIIKGVELWIRACLYDPAIADFDVFDRLVLIDGKRDHVAAYERYKYQTRGPDGRLTADSMIGNPIHPITLRVATDLAWIPSDAAFTDPIVRTENDWLTQTMKMREANLARFFHSDQLTEPVDKLKLLDVGQGVAVPHELMMQGADKLFWPIPHLENAQSDVQGAATLHRYREETLGFSANQAGSTNATQRSATETAIVQQNSSVRIKGETNILKQRIVAGIRKFDALVMRYGSRGYVQIVGKNGAQLLTMFDRQMISGRYAYDAHPDSMTSKNAEDAQRKWQSFTNFTAKSPFIDQEGLLRQGAEEYGYDASKMIRTPPPPPEPPPEKPRISFAFNGADLAIPEVRQILGLNGVKLEPMASPEAMAAHQAEQAKAMPHGGAADRADLVSEHHSQMTGAQDGRQPVAPAPPTQAIPGRGLH
jgi:hypothetical protein